MDVATVVDNGTADALTTWVMDAFPTDARSFLSSLSAPLLRYLSAYFFQLPYPSSDLEGSHKYVELARVAIQTLSTLTLGDDCGSPVSPRSPSGSGKRKFQWNNHAASIDLKTFRQLGVQVPASN